MLKKLIPILKDIRDADGRGLIVGGFTRDMLLGVPSKDIDVEVHGMTLNVLTGILERHGRQKLCGKSFGVLKVDDFDFSIPRIERKVNAGHKGFDVVLVPHLGIEKATERRDLTIGGILFDPFTDEIIDPFGGVDDVKKGIIRHIKDETFAEDPLRVLRVAQFHARFDFKVAPETEALCVKLLPEMTTLTRERVFTEIEKIMLKSKRPSKAFDFLLRTGVLEIILPEVAILDTIDQGTKHHAEGSVYRHAMMALDAVPMEDRDISFMLAVLLHDTGKALVDAEIDGDTVHFFGHEKVLDAVHSALDKLTTEKAIVEDVEKLVSFHMIPYTLRHDLRKKLVRKLAVNVDVERLLKLHRADKMGRLHVEDLNFIDNILAVFHEIRDEIKPLVLGRHLIEFLGLTPGPHFGILIKKAFKAQLDGEFSTLEDGLKFVKESL
jgi:tRNA nucleotidyltransferase (CCA-adding enzyme)